MKFPSAFLLASAAIVSLASVSFAEESVWVPAQTGTLIGGGYARSGSSEKPTTASASSLDHAGLRSAVLALDAQAGKKVEGWELIASAVSIQTGVPVPTLQRQHATTHLSYGELLVANSLAKTSRKSFATIIAMKGKVRGWGELSRQLGVNPDSIAARARTASEQMLYASTRRDRHRDQNIRDAGYQNSTANPGGRPGG